ncbi:MAG: hypothetical protein WAT71_18000 [Ignavibacteria bacterium]
MESLNTKNKFIELRAQGYSFDKIAKELKKSKVALVEWAKEYEGEIANLKALELEALYEKYYLLKEYRIKHFGTILNKVKNELDKRDLKDVSTDKLIDIYNKMFLMAKDEITEPSFKSSREIAEEKENKDLLDELTAPETEYRKLKAV